MLKILDEKILRTDNEIEELYENCKYLCTIDSYDKLADNNGYLYCISTSEDSYDQLYEIRSRLMKEGKCCVIGGSYNNGGAVGVQYECKCEGQQVCRSMFKCECIDDVTMSSQIAVIA